MRTVRYTLMALMALGLLAGCGGSKKSRRLELTPQDLEVHKHVLVVGAGPAMIKLDVGMAGKLMVKGLNHIAGEDKNSSFAKSLREAGLLPVDTAMQAGLQVLKELGWQATQSATTLDKAGKKYKKVKLPDGLCQEAASSGADSVLILYQRMIIDVGATDALAKNRLWAHFFACPSGELLWRGKDKRNLSLKRFIIEAAKQIIAKKEKTLADILISLRKTTSEAVLELLPSGLKR